MSIFLFIMFATFLYSGIGVGVGRVRYARALSGTGDQDTFISERLTVVQSSLKNMRHSSNCWLGPHYRKRSNDYSCDCSQQFRWTKLHKEEAELEAGNIAKGSLPNPYLAIPGWPVIFLDTFLKGGKVKQGYNAQLTARLERELEIGIDK